MNSEMKYKFYFLISILFIAGLMELFGLAMIIPVIKIIIEPNEILSLISKYDFLNFLMNLDRFKLTAFILLFTLGVYVIKNFYLLIVSWYQVTFLRNFTNQITSKIFNNILKKKYLYFTNENSTNFIKIIGNDSMYLRNNLHYCAQIISELFTISLISTLLFYTHPYAMITSIILFIFGTLIFLFVLKKKTKVWAEERSLFEKRRLNGIKQIINSIRDLKLLNVEKKFSDQFAKDNDSYLNVNRKQELMLTVPRIWIEMLTIFTVLCLLFILIFLDDFKVLSNSIIPILALYVGASFKLIPSFNRIITGIQSIRFMAPILEEYKTLSKENKNDAEVFLQNNEKINFKNNIKIKNLSFSYNKSDNILENLNLNISHREKIGILGKSGSGKSTLLDIVTGMIDEYFGEVLVDGKNIDRGIRSWRNSISYLSQNSVFLNDTIKNNILLGSSNINEELLKKSIDNSLISELINYLPMKENTPIGENAVKLSGGERQRVALARIFYLKRDFLILDESTNALDIDTEKKVLENIWSEFSDKTIIQVSHNTEVLKYCDKVYKLSDKKLVLA